MFPGDQKEDVARYLNQHLLQLLPTKEQLALTDLPGSNAIPPEHECRERQDSLSKKGIAANSGRSSSAAKTATPSLPLYKLSSCETKSLAV
jgi:hypothetical protein